LGTTAASVQFSRSLGAALGTAIVGIVLFASLAMGDPQAARLFEIIVQKGPGALHSLPLLRQAAMATEVAAAFRAAFLAIAMFAIIGLGLAWSLPLRRV